jgi:hypothetical protein
MIKLSIPKIKVQDRKKEQNKEVCIYIVISTFKEVITQKQVVDIFEETTPVMRYLIKILKII